MLPTTQQQLVNERIALFARNEHGALSQHADDLTHPVQRTANTRFAVAQHILSLEPNSNSL